MNEDEKLKYEMRRDAIDEAFRESPSAGFAKIEDLGFCFAHDETSREEEREERVAVPQTPDQSVLIECFEKGGAPTDVLLQAFIKEKHADDSNYPLFRRYFKQGNKGLTSLLLYGHLQQPTNPEFLSDLSFMHIFSSMLKELIDAYILACNKETDAKKFAILARDFYNNTAPDGYDALCALEEIFLDNSEKQAVLTSLRREVESDPETIFF